MYGYNCTDEITDVIRDSLRYPALEKAYNNLNNFEQDSLYKLFYQIIEDAVNNAFDNGFSEGHAEGYGDCNRELCEGKEKEVKNEDG